MDWLKEKNSSKIDNCGSEAEGEVGKNNIELEENDILALVISAILVFGPILLVLIIIIILLFKG